MPFIDDSVIVLPPINTVFTSTSEPANPNVGDIWNQVDVNGILLEKWEAISHPTYNWRSVEKTSTIEQSITIGFGGTSRVYYFGVNNNDYDVLIRQNQHIQFVTNPTNSPAFMSFQLQRLTEGTASVALAVVNDLTVSNVQANKVFRSIANINRIYVKDGAFKTTFRYVCSTSSGHNTNLVLHDNLIYHYLR